MNKSGIQSSVLRRTAGLLLVPFLALSSFSITAEDLQKMQDLALQRYGENGAKTVSKWRSKIDENTPVSDQQKLNSINRFLNREVRWMQDIDAWGQTDYWATPLESMGHHKGDCEDFAIAKYMTLLLAGVDMQKVRITYVKAAIGGVNAAHMVLAYYPTPGAEPLILDNLVMDILPASQRPDLSPVFGFNSAGIWTKDSTKPVHTNPGAKISRWSGVLARASADGLN